MIQFKFILEITDIDTLLNVTTNCKALLIDEDGFWIEILEDGSYLVNDGWEAKKTNNIFEAINYYQEFKAKNS
jgi:hypothetical protein